MDRKFQKMFDYIDKKLDKQRKETINMVAKQMHGMLGDIDHLNTKLKVRKVFIQTIIETVGIHKEQLNELEIKRNEDLLSDIKNKKDDIPFKLNIKSLENSLLSHSKIRENDLFDTFKELDTLSILRISELASKSISRPGEAENTLNLTEDGKKENPEYISSFSKEVITNEFDFEVIQNYSVDILKMDSEGKPNL